MKRPLYIYFSPSLARLRKFRGIRGFCAALTKPRLLSPPGQLAGGCLQTGFFTCEPQHAPETNFKSGGRPGLPAGRGERPPRGDTPAGASGAGVRPALPARIGRVSGQGSGGTVPLPWERLGRDRGEPQKPCPVSGLRESPAEPRGGTTRLSRGARPARASSGQRERAGGGCAGLDSARSRCSPALAKYLISLHKLLFLACRLY